MHTASEDKGAAECFPEEADCCRRALVGCRVDGFFYATKLSNSGPARAQILDNPHHYRLLPYGQQDDRARKCRTT